MKTYTNDGFPELGSLWQYVIPGDLQMGLDDMLTERVGIVYEYSPDYYYVRVAYVGADGSLKTDGWYHGLFYNDFGARWVAVK